MRALAHRMVDDGMSYIETVAERPVWQQVPEQVAVRFDEPAPHQPADPDAAYEEFLETVFPYPMGNIHPRFWAWYMGNGTVMGALADFMAASWLFDPPDAGAGPLIFLTPLRRGFLF